MRIREVYLDGFGVFHDRRIVIGRGNDGNQGVVLFTGANETGKTTLMTFIRGILFGFEGETSRNFYAPGRGGRHGGNLEVETLKHSKPTFHGDTIYAETRVLDKKLTSKGDRGIVSVETKGINQRGEEVCYFKRKVMVWTNEAAPGRERPYETAFTAED